MRLIAILAARAHLTLACWHEQRAGAWLAENEARRDPVIAMQRRLAVANACEWVLILSIPALSIGGLAATWRAM